MKDKFQKIGVGVLLLTILASIIYITTMYGQKIRIDPDKTTFYIKENHRWVVAGREFNALYDGSRKMRRQISKVEISSIIKGNYVKIIRKTPYIRGPVIVDIYEFRGDIKSPELFPISHTVEIYNATICAKNCIYQYEVKDLIYSGNTLYNVTSPQKFGRHMKVEFQDGYYYSKIYKYKHSNKAKLTIRYRINNSYMKLKMRLFDPSIILNNPQNDSILCDNTVVFNCSVSITPLSITLYGDWGDGWHANETNDSGIQGDYIFTKTIPEGSYNWNCYAEISNATYKQGLLVNSYFENLSASDMLDYKLYEWNDKKMEYYTEGRDNSAWIDDAGGDGNSWQTFTVGTTGSNSTFEVTNISLELYASNPIKAEYNSAPTWTSSGGISGFGNYADNDDSNRGADTGFKPTQEDYVNFSLEFRIKTTTTEDDYIIGSGSGATLSDKGFSIKLVSGTPRIILSDGSSFVLNDFDFGCPAVNDGEWHHVVLVKNSSDKWVMYRDGVQCPNVATASANFDSTKNIYFHNRPALNKGLRGGLDQIIWWDIPLTESQIISLNNSESDSDPLYDKYNKTFFYKLNENSGTSAYDEVGFEIRVYIYGANESEWCNMSEFYGKSIERKSVKSEWKWYNFSFSDVTLNKGGHYCIYVNSSSDNENLQWGEDRSTATYDGGMAGNGVDGAVSDWDNMFEIWGRLACSESGKIGNAVYIDDDLILNNTVGLSNDGEWTLSIWIKPITEWNSSTPRTDIVYDASGSPNGAARLFYGWHSGKISCIGYNDNYADYQTTISADWHHLLCKYDGSQIQLWYDGNNVANKSVSGTATGTGPLRLHNQGVGFIADEFHFWNRSLTNSEINDLYETENSGEHIYYKGIFADTNYTFTIGHLDFNVTISPNTSLEFYPSSFPSTCVPAVNQTSTIGVFTIHNNLSQNINVYAKLNETHSGITLLIGNNSDCEQAYEIGETYQMIYNNLTVDETRYLWAWANYNNATIWYPELNIVACQ